MADLLHLNFIRVRLVYYGPMALQRAADWRSTLIKNLFTHCLIRQEGGGGGNLIFGAGLLGG